MEKKKLFLDLGAHRGNFCKAAKEILPDFKIIAFEANPSCIEKLKELEYVQVKPHAAWVEDTEIPLYIDKKGSGKGTTLMPNKISGKVDYENPVYVKAIDFSDFINKHKDHTIIVKMNIEGAEFPIFKKMLKDDTIKYIDVLLYAGHARKIQFNGRPLEDQVRRKVFTITLDKSSYVYDAIQKAKDHIQAK